LPLTFKTSGLTYKTHDDEPAFRPVYLKDNEASSHHWVSDRPQLALLESSTLWHFCALSTDEFSAVIEKWPH